MKKTRNKRYTRTQIKADRVREILARGGWMTAQQVVAELLDELQPDGLFRYGRATGMRPQTVAAAAMYAVSQTLNRLSLPSRTGHGTHGFAHLDRERVDGVFRYRLKLEYVGLTGIQIQIHNRRKRRECHDDGDR